MRRVCLLFVLTMIVPLARAEQPRVDFSRDIAPIFASHCSECHDARKQTASLRLDVRSSAMRGGESGQQGIVPGKPDKSEVIRRTMSLDKSDRMPPEGAHLSKQQIDLLRRWIETGANWPDELSGEVDKSKHWAFQSPAKPKLSSVDNSAWARNEIDRFVLARLEAKSLSPSPEADRITLIRRLCLDLTGLPPTIRQIDAFLADESPGAYERLVERLLVSPHYGERWGRHWLDAARFAESDGYEKDKQRQVWFYRDWVINSLNHDLPYDQFIIEQIAGDLLPDATQDQVVATGFLRNSMLNEEGGVDPEQFRMEAMVDRMDAIGKAILGLTIQCAQCHDHKYDPISQEEYYQMFAFLNNDHEANIAVYTPHEQMQRAELFRQIREIEYDLKHKTPDWQDRLAKWEEEVRADRPKWTTVIPFQEDLTTGGQKYLLQKDGSLLAQSYAPTKHVANFRVKTELKNITGFRLELLNDPNLPLGGPGRSIFGTAALTEFQVSVDGKKIKIAAATADLNTPEKELPAIYDDKSGKRRVTGPIEMAIDGDVLTAWGTDAGPGRRNQPRKAVFVPESPIANDNNATITFHLSQNHGGWNSDDNQTHNLGRFRLSITSAKEPRADPLPRRVREILSIPVDKRTTRQQDAVVSYWRTTVADWKPENERIDTLWQQHPAGTSQLVTQLRSDMRETNVLRRGEFLAPIKPVSPSTPRILHQLSKNTSADRLSFARWLADERSPTTARSIVNRVWQAYFGIGLVSTSEDFGTQAEAPSHPELLDWLTVQFTEGGWSLKRLHRLIVCSATFRQSSRAATKAFANDPYNRNLARSPRLRVDGEIVRDIALATSGLLNSQVGGPSSFPPLPEFMLKPPASYGPKPWNENKEAGRYRRGLYLFSYRSVPYPVLQVFDTPNGDSSCVRRSRSNTPLQALATLNESIFVECARALGLLTLKQNAPSDKDRLLFAFRRCLSRRPTNNEISMLLALLDRQRQYLADDESQAKELVAHSDEKPAVLPANASITDFAAWTVVARVLLNLDETITRE